MNAPNVIAQIAAAVPLGPACTLSLDGAGVRLLRRGRLTTASQTEVHLAVSGDARDSAELVARWADPGVSATACIRGDQQDMVFFSKVIGATRSNAGTGGTEDVDVVLAMPTQITSTRRRSSFRVAVSETDGIELKLWRIDPYAFVRDQPPPSRNLRASLCDLSANGLRAIIFANGMQALQLAHDQRFRVAMKAGDVEMIFDARLRHPRATGRDDACAFCGLEFKHDDDIDSRRNRQRLDAVLAKLQRSAAQRDAA